MAKMSKRNTPKNRTKQNDRVTVKTKESLLEKTGRKLKVIGSISNSVSVFFTSVDLIREKSKGLREIIDWLKSLF